MVTAPQNKGNLDKTSQPLWKGQGWYLIPLIPPPLNLNISVSHLCDTWEWPIISWRIFPVLSASLERKQTLSAIAPAILLPLPVPGCSGSGGLLCHSWYLFSKPLKWSHKGDILGWGRKKIGGEICDEGGWEVDPTQGEAGLKPLSANCLSGGVERKKTY